MESSTLDGNRRTTASAMSMTASLLPVCAPTARVRTESAVDTRSLAGVGAYGVPGSWRRAVRFGIAAAPAVSTTVVMAGLPILAVDQQDPSTHNFTRQGPPTCSPPV